MMSQAKDNPIKIIHLSSVHRDKDVRIFLKECRSLAGNLSNCEVHLILAGVDERCEENVHIHSVPKIEGSRIKRMWTTVNQVYRKAKALNGDIYHLHDPELMRVALQLKRNGKKVIYDAHEDLPRQIFGKSYLPMKKIVSMVMELVENFICARLDGIVTATPFIADRFSKINSNTIAINNFPLDSEIEFSSNLATPKQNSVCFIGGISSIRGTKQLVDAMALTDCKLDLVGEIPDDFRSVLEKSSGWKNVHAHGFLDRRSAKEIKEKSMAGMVTFLPFPNHVNAQPNKIFEYMAAGLPIIGSDFPLWKDLLLKNACGLCVDPKNPKEIADAIRFLQVHPEEGKKMGERGRKLVQEFFNWRAEEKKLVDFYLNLIQRI